METQQKKVFDYIVVGGGTAGAIVARRLAESPLVSVCLIEAGPDDTTVPKVESPLVWEELIGSEWDFDYGVEPQQRGNSKLRHSRARLLGGCSSHNSVIAFIPPDSDFLRWEKQGAAGWGPQGVAPYYERVRSKVALTQVEPINELNRAFVAAAEEAGFPQVEFNTKKFREEFKDCVGYFQMNTFASLKERCSSATAYLHPLHTLPQNLTLILNTMVTKIVFNEEKVAVAVETDAGHTIRANKEIVLCAGAIDSPRLLLLSGVGPAWHLRELDIPCVADVPGVGEHLIDHPETVVIWESEKPIPGPTSQSYEVGLFVSTQKHRPIPYEGPDLMYHFALEGFTMYTKQYGYPTAKHMFSVTPNVMRAQSQGTVRLASRDWKEKPKVDIKYFTDPTGYDEDVLISAVKTIRRVMDQSPMKGWVKKELVPGAHIQSDKDISSYVRQVSNSVYHPSGTCKMGAVEDQLAVVTPDLRVKGVKGLRVADASIFPSMVSLNPCLTCMMIGEKCASLIQSDSPFVCRL